MRALTIISIFLKPTNHISYAGKIYLNTVIVIGILLIITGILPVVDLAKDGKHSSDGFVIKTGLHVADTDGKLKATYHSDD